MIVTSFKFIYHILYYFVCLLSPTQMAVAGVGVLPPFVCVSVCFSTRWGQKVKGQGHESQKRCPRGSLHSCECWLLLVFFRLFHLVMFIYRISHGRNIEKTAKRYVHKKNIRKTYKDHKPESGQVPTYYIFITFTALATNMLHSLFS